MWSLPATLVMFVLSLVNKWSKVAGLFNIECRHLMWIALIFFWCPWALHQGFWTISSLSCDWPLTDAPGLQKLVESLCQVSPGYWGATDWSRNQFKSISQDEVTLCIQARSRVLNIIEWHNLTIMRATFHHPIQSCASVCNVVKVTLIITRMMLSIHLSLSLPFLPFCLPSFLP